MSCGLSGCPEACIASITVTSCFIRTGFCGGLALQWVALTLVRTVPSPNVKCCPIGYAPDARVGRATGPGAMIGFFGVGIGLGTRRGLGGGTGGGGCGVTGGRTGLPGGRNIGFGLPGGRNIGFAVVAFGGLPGGRNIGFAVALGARADAV